MVTRHLKALFELRRKNFHGTERRGESCVLKKPSEKTSCKIQLLELWEKETTQITKRLMVSEGMRGRKSQTTRAVSSPLSQILTKVTFEFNERTSAGCKSRHLLKLLIFA